MKKTTIAILIASGLVAAGVAIWFVTKPEMEATGGADKRTSQAVKVHAVAATTTAVPIVLDTVGTVEADQSVAVHAEVSGVLQRIAFHEGDMVKAGQLLFQIDPGVPQAEVDKAIANLARDRAVANEAQAQVLRLEPLVAKEYVTQQEYAQAKAQQESALSTVRADEAALKSVQLQLAYARITSPISGRAGMLNIKQGNLVSAASATPLVTINATRPVMVAFSVPQQQLKAVRQQQRAGAVTAEVRLEADSEILATGALAFIDNAVDTQTGTIRMKARFPNGEETIWPGELVALRLIIGVQKDALVIPESAVHLGQDGSFVYALADGKAQVQPITIARQLGDRVVVADGLKPGQPVVINPPNTLRPGSTVEQIAATDKSAGSR